MGKAIDIIMSIIIESANTFLVKNDLEELEDKTKNLVWTIGYNVFRSTSYY